ncbi:hypothetical protein FHG87_017563 [Trinorchestia longiramus]|nr:hypothetical protein FHG87_017563 [Trinorchestia longiramus]
MLKVLLAETPLMLLFQQENTSVDTNVPEHKFYVDQWHKYCEVSTERFLKANVVWISSTNTQKRKMGAVRRRDIATQTPPVYLLHKSTYKQQDPLRASKADPGISGLDPGVQRRLLDRLGWIERLLSSKENVNQLRCLVDGKRDLAKGRRLSISTTKASIEKLFCFSLPDSAIWLPGSNSYLEQPRVNALALTPYSPWLILAGYGEFNFEPDTDAVSKSPHFAQLSRPTATEALRRSYS